jgi:hypothetical protein
MEELKARREQAAKDKAIAMAAFAKEIADLDKQIADSEVTYSIGDRFRDSSAKKWIIVVSGGGMGLCVSMARLSSGSLYCGSKQVNCYEKITEKEFKTFGDRTATRYWDARKEEKV